MRKRASAIESNDMSSLPDASLPILPCVSLLDIPQYNPHFDLVCGYMRKKYNDRRRSSTWSNLTWKRRWFWIAIDIPERGNYILNYSNHEGKANLKPKRSFHLVGTKVVIHNSRTFSLQFPNQVLSLRCESDQEAYRWTSSLAHIIAVADLRAEALSKIRFSPADTASSLISHFLHHPEEDTEDNDSNTLHTNTLTYSSTSESDNNTCTSGDVLTRSFTFEPFSSRSVTFDDSSALKNIIRSPKETLPNFSSNSIDNNEDISVSRWGEIEESLSPRKTRSRSISTEVSSRHPNPDLARQYQAKRDEVIILDSPNSLWSFSDNKTKSLDKETLVNTLQRYFMNLISGAWYGLEIFLSFAVVNAVFVVLILLTLALSLVLCGCNSLVYGLLFVWNSLYNNESSLTRK